MDRHYNRKGLKSVRMDVEGDGKTDMIIKLYREASDESVIYGYIQFRNGMIDSEKIGMIKETKKKISCKY